MKLWIGRHCYAGNASDDPTIETSRPLVAEGIATAKAIANAMVSAGEIPNAIFCSGYQRATDTAFIYGKIFACPVVVKTALGPVAPLTDELSSWVQTKGREKLKRLMIVGHKDNTTPTMRDLDDGDWNDLVMGEVRRVEISRADLSWKLKWMIQPSMLGLKDRKS